MAALEGIFPDCGSKRVCFLCPAAEGFCFIGEKGSGQAGGFPCLSPEQPITSRRPAGSPPASFPGRRRPTLGKGARMSASSPSLGPSALRMDALIHT